MTPDEARCILDILECATDSNWPRTATTLTDEYGYDRESVIAAWRTLEKEAHVVGTAPEPEDF